LVGERYILMADGFFQGLAAPIDVFRAKCVFVLGSSVVFLPLEAVLFVVLSDVLFEVLHAHIAVHYELMHRIIHQIF